MYINRMQNITNNIPTVTKPTNRLLDNAAAFLMLAISSILINGIANSFINPFGLDPVFIVCSSVSALALANYAFPDRSKLSVVARGVPIVLLISCLFFILCNRIQHQAHNKLIPLNYLGSIYLFSWTPYLMAIMMFRRMLGDILSKLFK